MVSFTTTTIVNRRMHANMIRVSVFDLVYRALKWLVKEDIIGCVMFSA
jgi:Fe2+ or Zn2+ uptake regulation protein